MSKNRSLMEKLCSEQILNATGDREYSEGVLNWELQLSATK